jgi:Ser/Thr protein kinase RdoA (MazF antagonist)
MMILVGVIILFVTGFLLIRQFRSPAIPDEELYEDYEDDEFLPPVASSKELSRQEQLAALQILAGNALSAYALDVVDIEPFRFSLNTEFLVVAHPPLGGPPRRYVLRVNAPGYHTKEEIRSELEWLRALNEETALLIPRPIPTRGREWVTMVEGPNVPEPRYCVLFDFIPGKSMQGTIIPEQLEKVGSSIAALHQHGHRFNPSKDFTRKHWDLFGLSGRLLNVPVERAYEAFNESEMAVITRAEKMVAEATDQLGKSDEVYGLIHADLHEKSYHFQEGRVSILDFDTCGYGYYIYDLAVPMRNFVHQDEYLTLKKALFKGYRRIRSLSIIEERLVKHFVAGRLMIHTLMLAANRDHPAFKGKVDEVITLQMRMLKSVVASIMRQG